MKRLLILDVETTGLDPAKDTVIEVGAILYSVECATVLRSFATLIDAKENPAESINRIPPAALVDVAEPVWAWVQVDMLADEAEAVVAHSASFDRSFTPHGTLTAGLPWICSKNDLQWPKQTKPGPGLVALALEHDLGVAVAHRALADCDLIARLFTRARELGADLEAMLARALRPKALFQAVVSFEEKDLAKAAGFQWNAAARTWTREMAIEDAAELKFKTKRLATP